MLDMVRNLDRTLRAFPFPDQQTIQTLMRQLNLLSPGYLNIAFNPIRLFDERIVVLPRNRTSQLFTVVPGTYVNGQVCRCPNQCLGPLLPHLDLFLQTTRSIPNLDQRTETLWVL